MALRPRLTAGLPFSQRESFPPAFTTTPGAAIPAGYVGMLPESSPADAAVVARYWVLSERGSGPGVTRRIKRPERRSLL